MKLWLSRTSDGNYLLTKLVPEDAGISGGKGKELYPKKGEPIRMVVSAAGIEQLFAETQEFTHLAPLEMVRVDLTLAEHARIPKLKPIWKRFLGL